MIKIQNTKDHKNGKFNLLYGYGESKKWLDKLK
jgi:hypothetical protein